MNVSVLLGHPYEQSFNAAIAVAVVRTLEENGHTVRFHDLYGEGFDPVIFWQGTDQRYDRRRTACGASAGNSGSRRDHRHPPELVGAAAAIMKGWVDRVLREGGAYGFPEGDNGGGLPIGLLKAKAALVFNTSNTPQEREENVFGDPLERIWKDCIFDFCGVRVFDRIMFRVIADSTPEDREQWLDEARAMVNDYFPKPLPSDA